MGRVQEVSGEIFTWGTRELSVKKTGRATSLATHCLLNRIQFNFKVQTKQGWYDSHPNAATLDTHLASWLPDLDGRALVPWVNYW